MNRRIQTSDGSRARRPAAGFTLVELLTVMGIMLLLSVLTVVTVNRVAQDARLASGTNTVTATLGMARGLAIQRSSPVLVTFVPVWDRDRPGTPQVIEVVIAEATGRSRSFFTDSTANFVVVNLSSEFRPVSGVTPRTLPVGISVAGPQIEFSGPSAQATNWLAPPNFRNEERGQMVGVLFDSLGRVVTRLPNSPAGGRSHVFVNRSGTVDPGANPGQIFAQGFATPTFPAWRNFYTDQPEHEPNIALVDTLAIFDEREARDRYDVTLWKHGGASANPLTDPGYQRRQDELSQFITEFSNRVSFNRFSGVVQR